MSDDREALQVLETEVVDESARFFAPVDSDVIDGLIGRYLAERAKVERIAEVVTGPEYSSAVGYFLSGSTDLIRAHVDLRVNTLFDVKRAVFALNSRYWADALSLTDVYDCMPQARRDYWNAQLQGHEHVGQGRSSGYSQNKEKVAALPDFEETTVRNTLMTMLRERSMYFAERVDGIFRGLSGEHVTNAPEGFGKRMIMGYMLSYGSIRHERAGLIHDLRCVIAKFMGRGEPNYGSSDTLVRALYKCTGQWVSMDGGALRIRVYKKGTAHLEVHPEMAWRLNQVLASMHPLAIPAEFRTQPAKKAKEFQMMARPLPFATMELLAAGLHRYHGDREPNAFEFAADAAAQKAAHADACSVLEALGGTKVAGNRFEFDYPVGTVLRDVIITGCLPDQKAHQFYPTPRALAMRAIEDAEIGPDHLVLEPSAGQGGLADFLPEDRTLCIEVAELNAKVLAAKGHNVTRADFLAWASTAAQRFDRVVMNPPFSEGRARLHVEAASGLLRPGGRLVAIMPDSHRGKMKLPGCTCTWSQPIEGAFPGVSVTVAILTADRDPV